MPHPGFRRHRAWPGFAPTAPRRCLHGRHLTAAEAREIGLVNKVFTPEELMARTLEVARVIASKGKASLRAAKETISQGLNTDLATGLAIERDAFALCLASPDAQEGTSAFLEKRKPVFTGSRNG